MLTLPSIKRKLFVERVELTASAAELVALAGATSAQPKSAERLPVAFSNDGKLVAAGCKDGRTRLWETETGKPIKSLLRYTIRVCALAFTPDASLLLAGAEDGKV